MNSETGNPLDVRLVALKAATADALPPARVDRAVAAAVARAQRKQRSFRIFKSRGWLFPTVFAAAAAVVLFLALPLPRMLIADDPASVATQDVRNTFYPLVPLSEIEQVGDALVVPARMPRMMLVQLGFPVNPARAADAVDTELLVRGDGSLLAVRLVY